MTTESSFPDAGPNGVPKFNDEKQFQEWLVVKFENNGYDAITEVNPHNSNYRADMILLNGVGSPIGLELKYFKGGADAATAHKQIVERYSGRKYINRKIKRWAFAPYMPKFQYAQEKMDTDVHGYALRAGKMETLMHFFNKYGIGYLDIHQSRFGEIRWGKKEYRLPAFDLVDEVHDRIGDECNIEKIDQRIEDRLYSEGLR